MSKKFLQFNRLSNADLLAKAKSLPPQGYVQKTPSGLIYLKIDDDYIHRLFPLLTAENKVKPDYFGCEGIGAHISLIYPQENFYCSPFYLDMIYSFALDGLYEAKVKENTYYVLRILSTSLSALRRQCGLPLKLNFDGYNIDLHITIGKEQRTMG